MIAFPQTDFPYLSCLELENQQTRLPGLFYREVFVCISCGRQLQFLKIDESYISLNGYNKNYFDYRQLLRTCTIVKWLSRDQKQITGKCVLWSLILVKLVTKLCLTLATSQTVACKTPLSMGFSRQEYWPSCHSFSRRSS